MECGESPHAPQNRSHEPHEASLEGVRDRSEVLTFLNPVQLQSRKIAAVLRDEPALVMALDFMIWFGYGRVKGGDQARFGLQKRGLELLEKLDCPIVLGDYPDMHGADPKMLAPAQIPSVETLAQLNGALREWAAGRDNVRIFPLSEWVARAKQGQTKIPVEGRELTVGTESLLQSDRLHPTRLAMALIGVRLASAVDSLLPADSPLRIGEVGFDAMVDQAMARGELTDLIESSREPSSIKR